MSVSIVIPTYRRVQVLVNTIRYLHALLPPADEIVIVDQSAQHEPSTAEALQAWHDVGVIRWVRFSQKCVHAISLEAEARCHRVRLLIAHLCLNATDAF